MNREPRLFTLQRDVDETGLSGTGTVAEGIEFSDGVVALRWIVPRDSPAAGNPTSVVFHDNGIASVEKIHGHNGKTRIVWAAGCVPSDELTQAARGVLDALEVARRYRATPDAHGHDEAQFVQGGIDIAEMRLRAAVTPDERNPE